MGKFEIDATILKTLMDKGLPYDKTNDPKYI